MQKPSNDSKDLAVLQKAQASHDMSPNLPAQVVDDIKSSLIFQISWQELLHSAPTAINCLGACFVASSSDKAVVTLKSKGKFKYLKYDSLQANLVECANLGRTAFNAAQTGMDTIHQTSAIMNDTINNIIAALGDPTDAKASLKILLNNLQEGANDCHDSATKMDSKFDDWLSYVSEMHSAAVETEQSTNDALIQNVTNQLVAESQRTSQTTAVKKAQAAEDLLAKQVTVASDAYKKASDDFPSGWDVIGMQVVSDLADALTTGIKQAIPALVESSSPIEEFKAGAGAVEDGIKVIEGDDKTSTGTDPSGTQGTTSTPAKGSAAPKLQDPAYAEVLKIMTYLSAMNVIVVGKESDGNIDWEKARGDGTVKEAKSSIGFLSGVLSDAQTDFAKVATKDKPSTDLASVFEACTTIASQIDDEVKSSSDVSSSYPAKGSKQVKKWQTDFATAYDTGNTLAATARTLPGTAANGIPVQSNTAASSTSQTSDKSSTAQTILEAAKNRLATTQKMLTASQENYTKTTQMLLQQQNKLGQIQANLKKLTQSNITLTAIKAILIECIKLIVTLKQQVANLVSFFDAIATIIGITVKLHVDPFLQSIEGAVGADGTDPNKLKLGGYTLTDLQRTLIFSGALTLRAYFGVFGDIAKMWTQLSVENITPGLNLCDELSVTTTNADQLKKNLAALNAWSSKASDSIKTVAAQEQSTILKGMKTRVQQLETTTTQLTNPTPPASTVKAITDGAKVTKKAADDSIYVRAAFSGINRYNAIPDDD